MSFLLSTNSDIPKYTLSYVDDFYMYCDMEDRSIMIQHVDETNIQFDTKFKATGNCISYYKILNYSDYKVFKSNNYKLDTLKNLIELELSKCIFNYLDEVQIKLVKQHFGEYGSLDFSKITNSVAVEDNVHLFILKTTRFKNKDDAVPSEHEDIFLFDSEQKQVYVQTEKYKHPLLEVFTASRFSNTKIGVYESMTTDSFKVMIDNGLMGTVVCYCNNKLTIYDNTFGDIKRFDDPIEIHNLLNFLMLELITDSPSVLMTNYINEYDLDLNSLSSEQLKAVVMADY